MIGPAVGPPRSFEPDRFQQESIGHLREGRSVVVSAPTGSGKTYIAEVALARARAEGRRGLYTTPIKALSNQKFRDLGAWMGADEVGLLTGDNSINGDAGAVVMTTEVLRNMLYSEPRRLDRVGVVVMDEVHYLQDNYRGPVWEEVIIHLPRHIRLVALSATVSNADQLAAWIAEVHGPCVAVTETERPVALENSFMVGEKQRARLHVIPTLRQGRPNPEGRRFDPARTGTAGRRHGGKHRPRRPWRTPRRVEVIEHLDRRRLLPAITFIFSRAGCEDAVDSVRAAGVRLTDTGEAARIREIVDARTAHLSDTDRAALGHARWLAGLEAGIAAHHAGLVPLYKEVVEELFVLGLLRAVFATETLALGINMPAKTVVIEKLTKFTGEHHESLTPGDYTQLTGRAGRRGIDDIGHAVVLWSPFTTFDEVAVLARARTFDLRSAFRPTYNMTCHLVSRYTRREAEDLIGRSFGQFQTDLEVAELQKKRDRLRARLGDDAIPAETADDGSHMRREIDTVLSGARPGQAIDVGRLVAVLSVSWRRKQLRVKVLDRDGAVHVVDPDALDTVPVVVADLRLPEPFDPNNGSHQRDLVGQLRGLRRRRSGRKRDRRRPAPSPWAGSEAGEARRELVRVEKRIASRRGRLLDRFRSVIGLLTELGYVEQWRLTHRGDLLRGVFHELDLAITQSLLAGHLDGHDAPTLAGIVSAFVHEPRGSDEDRSDGWFSTPAAEDALAGITACAGEVRRLESVYGLPESRAIDTGLFAATHGWASGGGLDDVLADESLSGGDFVRAIKQVIDVLSQIALVAPRDATRDTAREALELLRRGVVDTPIGPPVALEPER